MLISKLQQKLLDRAQEQNLRQLSVSEGLVDFFSNDYLGLARDQALAASIIQESSKHLGNINGSTGSRLLSGNTSYALELEKKLAVRFKAEAALLFNSGYNANLAILSCIPGKGDTILYDELIHASLKEGARLSFAHRHPFKHNDLDDLERKLVKAEGEKFVVVESVYSMDGDGAPLKEMVELAQKYQAQLIVDEAHSTALWGPKGAGRLCDLGLEAQVFARVYTFGKGLGAHGAVITGSKVLIDYLINFARSFIYTTALPMHSLVTIQCAWNYLDEHPSRINSWKQVADLFKEEINRHSHIKEHLIPSDSPIQALRVEGNREVKALSEALKLEGLDVRPILSPTVKAGEERLRICLHNFNSSEEIKRLIEVLAYNYLQK